MLQWDSGAVVFWYLGASPDSPGLFGPNSQTTCAGMTADSFPCELKCVCCPGWWPVTDVFLPLATWLGSAPAALELWLGIRHLPKNGGILNSPATFAFLTIGWNLCQLQWQRLGILWLLFWKLLFFNSIFLTKHFQLHLHVCRSSQSYCCNCGLEIFAG